MMPKKKVLKRKNISKKLRFEIFKRDGFKCCYCGKEPPAVVLEIDHIEPVSKGGKSDINNYITACFDCNRGKSNVLLSKAPAKLSENLEILKEKEEQLAEYRKFVNKINRRIKRDIKNIPIETIKTHMHQALSERSSSYWKTFMSILRENRVING